MRIHSHLMMIPAMIALVATSLTAAGADPAKARRPNILLIVADDLGYADVGFHGARDVATPHLDALAHSGIRFTSGYVSAPVCSPSRAGFLTGRYQQRFGHEYNPPRPNEHTEGFGLPLSETLLPQLLKPAGYRTGLVGKWHLGYGDHLPLRRGFDFFFGFPGGSHSYTDAGNRANLVYRNNEPVEVDGYLTDIFGQEAVSFIEASDGPYFLYLAFNAVHNPMQAPEKYTSRFSTESDPKRRTFLGMLAAMDDAIGRVLEAARRKAGPAGTLVLFISDNGGPTGVNTSRNDPLRGTKSLVWEGGIRVPFVIAWPGVLPAGKVDDRPVSSLDILPTCLAAAGASPPEKPLDGVNLIPFLTGEKSGRPHEVLCWRFGPQAAIRQGDWKLVKMMDDPAELYNLKEDIAESRNLAASHPEKVRELTERYNAWARQMIDPLWAGRGAARAAQRSAN